MHERRSSKWSDAEMEAVRLDERARIRRELNELIQQTGHDLDRAVLDAAKQERARIRWKQTQWIEEARHWEATITGRRVTSKDAAELRWILNHIEEATRDE